MGSGTSPRDSAADIPCAVAQCFPSCSIVPPHSSGRLSSSKAVQPDARTAASGVRPPALYAEGAPDASVDRDTQSADLPVRAPGIGPTLPWGGRLPGRRAWGATRREIVGAVDRPMPHGLFRHGTHLP